MGPRWSGRRVRDVTSEAQKPRKKPDPETLTFSIRTPHLGDRWRFGAVVAAFLVLAFRFLASCFFKGLKETVFFF